MCPIIHHDAYQKDDLDAPTQDSPHGRSRQWEREHLDEKVVYRGVHPGYVREVKRLAAGLHLPQGDVACSILEYSLHRYEQGFLDLVPRLDPRRMRMTLLPLNQNKRRKIMKRKSKSPPEEETSWRRVTTWRNFSPETKRTISALASEEALNVPVGQLVNALLRYGLQAHQAGLLNLEPAEKAAVLTLLGEGEA
ncbi:MAG TPA: hypothetical protein VLA72_18530 [Anaerolineales bacterium]|nr:hypothetical protein [Anaerolineales bacterium]